MAPIVDEVLEFAKSQDPANSDYSDRSIHRCDKVKIGGYLARLIAASVDGHYGKRFLYIKGEPVEIARNKKALSCKVDVRDDPETDECHR